MQHLHDSPEFHRPASRPQISVSDLSLRASPLFKGPCFVLWILFNLLHLSSSVTPQPHLLILLIFRGRFRSSFHPPLPIVGFSFQLRFKSELPPVLEESTLPVVVTSFLLLLAPGSVEVVAEEVCYSGEGINPGRRNIEDSANNLVEVGTGALVVAGKMGGTLNMLASGDDMGGSRYSNLYDFFRRQGFCMLAKRNIARDEVVAVQIVVVIQFDALHGRHGRLLQLVDCQISECWEGPAVQEGKNDLPVLIRSITERVNMGKKEQEYGKIL